MVQVGPLQVTEPWKYALIGGLLALPFTLFEVLGSPKSQTVLGCNGSITRRCQCIQLPIQSELRSL